MKSPLIYLIETIVCSGLFLVVYRLLLERHASFRVCRCYLLCATAAAALIPLLNIPVYSSDTVYLSIPVAAGVGAGPAAEPVAAESSGGWGILFAGLYLCGAAALLALVVRRVVFTLRLRRESQLVQVGGRLVAYNEKVESPFSFLSTIYLGDGFAGSEREQVLAHETSHIVHRHSQERMAMECMKALLWFNPFVWMASRSLVEIQEFEADADVLSQGHAVADYRMTILKQIFGVNPDITCGLNCGLNNSRIVKRFARMTAGRPVGNLRLLASLPVLVGTMMAFGFTEREPRLAVAVPQAGQPAVSAAADDAASGMTASGELSARGRVTFEDGAPVAGAAVVVPGTTHGVATDSDGRFGLQTGGGSELKVIYVNAAPVTVQMPEQPSSELSVVLPRPDSASQADAAAGTQDERSSDELQVEKVTVFAFGSRSGGDEALPDELPESLAGAVQSADGSQVPRVIHISGSSVASSLSDALVVIDGECADGERFRNLVPGDIAGIEIVKDARTVEQYCKRLGVESAGKSGIIVVTTRKKK